MEYHIGCMVYFLSHRYYMENATKVTGTVKWFDERKGFGFLSTSNGEEIFVHYKSIKSDGFRTLKEGQTVSFEIVDDAKGKKAEDVVVI